MSFFDDEDEKPQSQANQVSEPGERDNEPDEWQSAESIALAVDSGAVVTEPGAAEFNLGTMMTPAISATFSILAPAWEVTDSECEALGTAWGDCFAVWFPDAQLSPKYAVLGTAVLTTAMVVAPRMKIPPKKIEKEVKKDEAA